MALVKVKPTSAGRRGLVKVVNDKLHKASRSRDCSRRRRARPVATTPDASRRVTWAAATSSITA